MMKLEVPGNSRSILLHACCAPCSGAIVECMVQNGLRPVIFYSNSNIHPKDEYDIRLNECIRYARECGLDIVEDTYDHDAWLSFIRSSGSNPESISDQAAEFQRIQAIENAPERGPRCLKCFKFRLLRAAEYASSHGFEVLTTTLASSRWKNLDQVNEAGEFACSRFPGVTWWPRNWRKDGLQERRTQIIKERCFYNQLYCGCEFSQRRPSE